MRSTSLLVSCGAILAACSACSAQTYTIDWSSLDCGGATAATAGAYILGASIGQPITGEVSAGGYQVGGGFWQAAGDPPCYANCDNSATPPILNANDFQCFLNSFAAAAPYANCDSSTVPPVLNANDFQCFLNNYAAGCT